MKKIIRLTESDLVNLVKRVIKEQSQSNKIEKGTLLTVVKKTDKSSNPKEEMALVKVVYDNGQGGKRAEIKISGQSGVQQPIDMKKMEFGDYKIIKINGQPVNQPAKPVQPPTPKVPTKGSNKIVFPTPEKKKDFIFPKNNFINKTVNLYNDSKETEPNMQVKILDVRTSGHWVYLKFQYMNRNQRVSDVDLIYSCKDNSLRIAGDNPLPNFYNKKFTDELKSKFCDTSRGGASVGKADYTSIDQTPSTMA
jgi:hypothetical protein